MAALQILTVVLLAVLAKDATSLPAPGQGSLPPINWDNIQPRVPTVTEFDSAKDLPQDLLMKILNMGPEVTERYPGYVKGTKSMSGECGIPGAKDRIVGGTEATPHSYPWMAALFVNDQWFCGGTLISPEWVLTAAHCAHDASHMRVMLGAHNIQEASEEGRIEIETTDFFTHQDYNPSTIHNDIALVHLPEPIEFNDIIRPVCLPTHSEENEKWDHLDCQASGWGKPTDSATSVSPVLREVTVDTITNLACAIQFPLNVNKNIICISGKDGKSTCNGDSGGPLHLVQNGIFKQIGITSFGSSQGCEIGKHAAFTRPTSYLQWIETNTGIAIDP